MGSALPRSGGALPGVTMWGVGLWSCCSRAAEGEVSVWDNRGWKLT